MLYVDGSDDLLRYTQTQFEVSLMFLDILKNA